jgi:hypothetical protein
MRDWRGFRCGQVLEGVDDFFDVFGEPVQLVVRDVIVELVGQRRQRRYVR